jgi:hypothetical protein
MMVIAKMSGRECQESKPLFSLYAWIYLAPSVVGAKDRTRKQSTKHNN